MIEHSVQQEILADFERQKEQYFKLAKTLKDILEKLLDGGPVKIHEITSRVKTRDSLGKKIAKGNKQYRTVQDITDVVGARVTTYYAADVDGIAGVIEKNFAVDRENSPDKRKMMDPDRFGYLSVHYVATLPPELTINEAFAPFASNKFEVQLRSLCQHAWAEIEHDEGYKSKLGVPRNIRRRFSRMAGLLELADEEFATIRTELRQYADDVKDKVGDEAWNVEIDRISLIALFSVQTSAVNVLARSVAEIAGAQLVHSDRSAMDWNVDGLTWLGFTSIGQLEKAVNEEYGGQIVAFAREWYRGSRRRAIRHEVVVLFLGYVLLSARDEGRDLPAFLEMARVASPHRRATEVERIRQAYHRSQLLSR